MELADFADLEVTIKSELRTFDVSVIHLHLQLVGATTFGVVTVADDDYARAAAAAPVVSDRIENLVLAVKKADKPPEVQGRIQNLQDERVDNLLSLTGSLLRSSDAKPSLEYIVDTEDSLARCLSATHQLIFGRRGVGKSALMAIARDRVKARGHLTFWMNLQPLASLDAAHAFLAIAAKIASLGEELAPITSVDTSKKARELREFAHDLLPKRSVENATAAALLRLQDLLKIVCQETKSPLYIFLDDVHYVGMKDTPKLLDYLHGVTRDLPIYLKIAGIQHQMRWFSDEPPIGLQLGHDAESINLDVTLEAPDHAKQFLEKILLAYFKRSGINSISSVFAQEALDRLVLASGGVPRDFLVLAAQSIRLARLRTKARQVGKQDVSEAAGEHAKVKTQELEKDAASSIGSAKSRLTALANLQEFLLEVKKTTYFKVSFADKEASPKDYETMQSLMDLRMIHLLNQSLSDGNNAGQRYEVYLFDLSRYSAQRLRRQLFALEYSKNHFELKETGTKNPPKVANSPRALIALLRLGPEFRLANLSKPKRSKEGRVTTRKRVG